MLFKFYLSPPLMDPRLAITVHFLQNEMMRDRLLSLGFDPKSLVVTGNPLYDKFFQQISKKRSSNDKLIHVLFAPDTLYEFGEWTKEQRDSTIEKIIKNLIGHRNEMTLTIKIHPSAAILSEYQSIIHSIDPQIPIYQKGGVQDFLENTDVLITFTSSSSSVVYSMLARVPIIICNFVNLSKKEKFLEKELAYECKSPDDLISYVHKAIKENPITNEKRSEYIREYLYKDDGKAAQRMCNVILELASKNN